LILSVSASSQDTHWLLSHVTILTAAAWSNVTVALPLLMMLTISAADKTPGVPVHSPPLAPSVNSQPAAIQPGSFMVKLRP
jgi:hypothetical protein